MSQNSSDENSPHSQGLEKTKKTYDFELLIQNSPIATYTCDKEGNITFFNKAAVELWGREPNIITDRWTGSWKVYHTDGTLMHQEGLPIVRAFTIDSTMQADEVIIERPDHTFKSLTVYPRLIMDEKGQIIGVHNTLVDITSQKQVEEKQFTLSAIVSSSDDAIISKNLNGIITSWNDAAIRLFGYTEEEILGKHISTLIPAALLGEEDTIINKIRAGGQIDHFQTVRLHKSGAEVNLSITVSPVRDSSGRITGASKIARDISDRLLSEKAIKLGTERLEILHSVGKVIAEKLDVKIILQQVTDATTKITGAAFGAFFYNTLDERGEALMLYALSGAPREAFEKFGKPRNTAVFEPTFSGREIVRVDDIRLDPRYGQNNPYRGMPSGHLPVVSYLAVPVVSSSEKVIGSLLFGHPEPGIFTADHEDLVENIALQAAVALDNAMLFEEVIALSAKKDEFIALASHELKTPLTTVKGYLQVLERFVKEDTGRLFINKALKQVEKLNTLVNDLLDVSRIEASKLNMNLGNFNIGELIKDVIETHSYAQQTHKIIFEDPDFPIIINGDQQRIEQVMINLIGNAIKYSPSANKVKVSLAQMETAIAITVKDSGMGLTEEQQKNIFTRFYRAEGLSHVAGLGLGLYLTKEIVERHNGEINVKSELGRGSEFTVVLPLYCL